MSLKYDRELRREQAMTRAIPYTAHMSAHVVTTFQDDYVQVFRIGGASFETADDAQLNQWHERLNVLWRNVARENVSLWTHVIRRRHTIDVTTPQHSGFAEQLAARYTQRLAGETLMVNELYLSIVYRPSSGRTESAASKLWPRKPPDERALELRDALEVCDKLAQTLMASLERYEPQRLGVYRWDGRVCSSLLEFLGLLINGEWQRMSLPHARLDRVLTTSRPIFGFETLEYRTPTQSRLGAMLGIIEYATPTQVGMLNALLAAPFPFVLTQSFSFLKRSTAQGLLQRQYNRLQNAGDFAVSQAEALRTALDELTSNEWSMGDHHFSLQVLTDGIAAGEAASREASTSILNQRIADARSLLADCTGMTIGREDLALEAAYWAQLPGNFSYRPRKAPITTRNWSAFSSFHNHPTGRSTGNHWGEALAVLATRARSPYFFSLHASHFSDTAGGHRTDTGHTLICGPTGSGKTVLIGFLLALLHRQGATQVVFDRNGGLEILIRALGGVYVPLRNGQPTGFNPLQLPPQPHHLEFLKSWLRTLVACTPGETLSVREQADLDQALHGTLALDLSARRLSRLIEFTDPTDPEGLYARLSPWCACTGGDYAWVFDQAEDIIVTQFATQTVLGFDLVELLGNAVTRTPVTLYLFHLVQQLLDGRRLVCWMDEFWRLLEDPAFTRFATEGPKTWRMSNGVMAFATQSLSDVLKSPISRTLIEQTATQIYFPTARASRDEYQTGFGLSERELTLLTQELDPGSGEFLVKQGHHSIACELDLKGFTRELTVLSGRTQNLERMHQLIAEHGPDPAEWLPAYLHI